MSFILTLSGSSNDPKLDTHDVKLLALVTEWPVQESLALAAAPFAERVVQPQAVLAIAAPDGQEARLALHAVVVDAAVRKVLEADALCVQDWSGNGGLVRGRVDGRGRQQRGSTVGVLVRRGDRGHAVVVELAGIGRWGRGQRGVELCSPKEALAGTKV